MKPQKPTCQVWAEFRFSVIGPLLANPPDKGKITFALKALAEQTWTHPITSEPAKWSSRSLERWYIAAKQERYDSVAVLATKKREDTGIPRVLTEKWITWLREQYGSHPSWSWHLHWKNLRTTMRNESEVTKKIPSYDSVRRFLKHEGLYPRPKPRKRSEHGEMGEQNRIRRERRSFESPYVGGVWCFDFHFGSREVLTDRGTWITPKVLGIIDDHSRLICHLQWFEDDGSETLCHGFIQAFLKRGLPRSVFCDRGAAMRSAEFEQGLSRLGIMHHLSAPYDPERNGKIEKFWQPVENNLLAMLENKRDLTLHDLNRYTQAWVEREYNRQVHSETKQTPLERFLEGKSILRRPPEHSKLIDVFRMDTKRRQRRGDGTISLGGIRFEIPRHYLHFTDVWIRYARWNPTYVHLINPDKGEQLCRLSVQNRQANMSGKRAALVRAAREELINPNPKDEVAPHLQHLLAEFAATGLPMGFIPKKEHDNDNEA